MSDFYKFIQNFWRKFGIPIGLINFINFLKVKISLKVVGALLLGIAPLLLGWNAIYVVAAVLCFYFAYVEIKHKRIPLTVLSTKIELVLNTPEGDRATLSRTQRIRANHHDVTGYHRYFSIDSDGDMPQHLVRCDIEHCTDEEQSLMFDPSPPNVLEFIHRFKPIPRNLLKLGLNTVERSESIVQNNAYIRDEEYHEIFLQEHYKHKAITMTIYFHPDRQCESKDCEALLINSNGVVKLVHQYVLPKPGTGHGIRLHIKRPLPGERYKIIWKYPPLRSGDTED